MTKVPSDADIVFFPTQKPAAAQTFGQQLARAGQEGEGLRRRRLERPGRVQGSRLVRLQLRAADHSIAADKAIIAAWKKDNPGKAVGSFGPPTYGAVQVILHGDQECLRRGQGLDRKRGGRDPHHQEGPDQHGLDPRRQVRLVDKANDPLNAKFYIMQIQPNGTYKLVN